MPAGRIATAARRSAPRPSYQQNWPGRWRSAPLLTGEGHLAPMPAVPRLIDALDAACIAGSSAPPAPAAGRSCASTSRWTDAGLPDVHRPLADRAVHTLRSPARARHPRRGPATVPELPRRRPGEPGDLPRLRSPPSSETRTPDGPSVPAAPRSRCWPAPSAVKPRHVASPAPPASPGARPASAARLPASCGRLAAIASGTLAGPLCADCTAPPAWADCPACSDPGHPSPGQCARCRISQRLMS